MNSSFLWNRIKNIAFGIVIHKITLKMKLSSVTSLNMLAINKIIPNEAIVTKKYLKNSLKYSNTLLPYRCLNNTYGSTQKHTVIVDIVVPTNTPNIPILFTNINENIKLTIDSIIGLYLSFQNNPAVSLNIFAGRLMLVK